MKRERRRLQEQLRRIKRNEEKLNSKDAAGGGPKHKKKKISAKDIKVSDLISSGVNLVVAFLK